VTFPVSTIGLGKLEPGPGRIGLREFTVEAPGPDQVVVAVDGAGICGTDVHIADDEFPSDPPVTMGHEVAGTVVALGPGAAPDWMGARVACETYYHYCGECDFCREGSPNLCAERRSIGSHVDGGFARWVVVPVRNLHRVPESVGRAAGALAEPLACVANCLFDPPVVGAGDRVLVVGPGTMGVLTAQVARAAGGEVLLVGLPRDRDRLAVGAGLGLATAVVDRLPGSDFDVVAECSGAAAGAELALTAVRRGGRYVQVGIFGRPIIVPMDEVLYRELTVTSGNASTPRSWRRAMRLLETGLVRLDPLVSEIVPLANWERAFTATRAGEGMKHVLDPTAEP
jgi:L-iditol 2-dehydrogenase